MTSPKHFLDKDTENDLLLRIDVERINERNHVGITLDKHFEDKDPKISRRVIRGLRNELAQLINQQKDNGADITEFEHILYRDESETEEEESWKKTKGTIYDKSNGKVYIKNGRPQIRCPSKGLRALPRLDYTNRYSAKTGKPLNRSEARLEDIFFRTPLSKKSKMSSKDGDTTEENASSSSKSMTENSDYQSSARSSVSNTAPPLASSSACASTENESQEEASSVDEDSRKSVETSQSQPLTADRSTSENSIEEAVSIILSQNFNKLKEKNETEISIDDSAVSGLFAQPDELD